MFSSGLNVTQKQTVSLDPDLFFQTNKNHVFFTNDKESMKLLLPYVTEKNKLGQTQSTMLV